MEKIQDKEVIDNEFVEDMYKKLLEDYLTYSKDREDSLLHDDIKYLGEDEVKRKILSQHDGVEYEDFNKFIKRQLKCLILVLL
jgi:hypothetical protein